MRTLSGLTYVLLGFAVLSPGCMKLDLFKRGDPSIALSKGPGIGTPAPEIDGSDFDGTPLKLSEYRGKVVVLTFWASWCRPCRDLIPHERELVDCFRDRPFALVGVNYDKNTDAARKVIASHGITWRNWPAGGSDSAIDRVWQIEALPTVYVIDCQGVIRYKSVYGPHLKNAVEALLAEAESKRHG